MFMYKKSKLIDVGYHLSAKIVILKIYIFVIFSNVVTGRSSFSFNIDATIFSVCIFMRSENIE